MDIPLNRKYMILACAVILLVSLFLGETALLRVVTVQRSEIERELRVQDLALRRQVLGKTRLVERYKQALVELERFPMGEPGDPVTLFANIEAELAKNGLVVDSIRPTGFDPATLTATTDVSFNGDFFAVLRTMADWRNGMQPIRLSNLSLKSGENPKGGIPETVSARAVLVSKLKPIEEEGGK